jgi:hypothetical protein
MGRGQLFVLQVIVSQVGLQQSLDASVPLLSAAPLTWINLSGHSSRMVSRTSLSLASFLIAYPFFGTPGPAMKNLPHIRISSKALRVYKQDSRMAWPPRQTPAYCGNSRSRQGFPPAASPSLTAPRSRSGQGGLSQNQQKLPVERAAYCGASSCKGYPPAASPALTAPRPRSLEGRSRRGEQPSPKRAGG